MGVHTSSIGVRVQQIVEMADTFASILESMLV